MHRAHTDTGEYTQTNTYFEIHQYKIDETKALYFMICLHAFRAAHTNLRKRKLYSHISNHFTVEERDLIIRVYCVLSVIYPYIVVY